MQTVTTLVVDSSRLFREGLGQLLAGTQFRIAAELSSIAEVSARMEAGLDPALVLVELDNAPDDTFEQLKHLRTMLADAKLVVLANRLSSRALAQSLEAGADGYLLKNMSVEALLQSLNLVMLGEKVFPTQLATLLVEGKARPERPLLRSMETTAGLSEREMAILRCLVHGYPNKVIADQLQMTEASVKVHLKAVLRKIHVSNRTQAAIWAINNGFKADQPGPGTN